MDDSTSEALLAGRYQGGAPDLAAVSVLLEKVRSLAESPVPRPNAALARLLSGSDPGRGDRRLERPRRSKRLSRPAVATAVSVVLAGLLVAAATARVLPGPAQDLVAEILRTVTPIDVPKHSEPGAVPRRTPTPESPADSTARSGPDSSENGTREAVTNGPEPLTGHDGLRFSRRGGWSPLPAVPTTVPATDRRPPDGVTDPVDPPKPEPHRFRADLAGAMGSRTAGDPDGHGTAAIDAKPGSRELCLTLTASGAGPITAVHLHGEDGATGGLLVAEWTEPTAGAARRCVSATNQLINAIRRHPGSYSVDVHTTEFPQGALRGPLTTAE